MAENTAAEKSYDCDENIGRIRISEQVVAVIAGIAATEVEGVESLVGNITNEIVAKMGHGMSSNNEKFCDELENIVDGILK